ncbi:MAG TPA: CHAT domain-containing protein, partial [Gemmatimonadaceae bacterium]
ETVAVVEDFYRALSQGATVGSALREAKLAAMRRGAPVRDWASFAVIGDPTMRVPLEAPSDARWWWIAAAVAAAVVGTAALAVAARHRRVSAGRAS